MSSGFRILKSSSSSGRLFRNAQDPGPWTDAASGGLNPNPAVRVRGAHPHALCSKAASSHPFLHNGLLSAPSWRTVIGAALGNNTVEVVDTFAGRDIHGIPCARGRPIRDHRKDSNTRRRRNVLLVAGAQSLLRCRSRKRYGRCGNPDVCSRGLMTSYPRFIRLGLGLPTLERRLLLPYPGFGPFHRRPE